MTNSLFLPKSIADARVAANIKNTARHRLDSDDWATTADVKEQLGSLILYIEHRLEDEPDYVMPKPTGWKIMVLMLTIPETSAGGVIIVDDAKEQRALSSPQGVILGTGPAAYSDKDRFTLNGKIMPWCEVGDRVTFVKYDASLFQLGNGQRIGFLNDTQPVSVLDSGWRVPQ